jgi:hypothetical protein
MAGKIMLAQIRLGLDDAAGRETVGRLALENGAE